MISVTILNLLVRKLKSLGVGFRRPIYTSHFGEVFRFPVASYVVWGDYFHVNPLMHNDPKWSDTF